MFKSLSITARPATDIVKNFPCNCYVFGGPLEAIGSRSIEIDILFIATTPSCIHSLEIHCPAPKKMKKKKK
jgi:hypothetical protein